jgi:hypothetical protein
VSIRGRGATNVSARRRGKSNTGAEDDQRRLKLDGEISSIHRRQDFFPFLLVFAFADRWKESLRSVAAFCTCSA